MLSQNGSRLPQNTFELAKGGREGEVLVSKVMLKAELGMGKAGRSRVDFFALADNAAGSESSVLVLIDSF